MTLTVPLGHQFQFSKPIEQANPSTIETKRAWASLVVYLGSSAGGGCNPRPFWVEQLVKQAA
ncbi:MAG: hypothetical protein GY820_00610 [Gammaproteobacteria bacterium]|nr:hypothetical protein [Gammaproteobacteria bacterium]